MSHAELGVLISTVFLAQAISPEKALSFSWIWVVVALICQLIGV